MNTINSRFKSPTAKMTASMKQPVAVKSTKVFDLSVAL